MSNIKEVGMDKFEFFIFKFNPRILSLVEYENIKKEKKLNLISPRFFKLFNKYKLWWSLSFTIISFLFGWLDEIETGIQIFIVSLVLLFIIFFIEIFFFLTHYVNKINYKNNLYTLIVKSNNFNEFQISAKKNKLRPYTNIEIKQITNIISKNNIEKNDISKNKINEIIWNDKTNGYIVDERDGQKYNVVKIGNQIWFAENLKFKLDDEYFIKSNNFKNNVGGYNYYLDMLNIVCPKGWKIPTVEDFNILFNLFENEKKFTNLKFRNVSEFKLIFSNKAKLAEYFYDIFWIEDKDFGRVNLILTELLNAEIRGDSNPAKLRLIKI